MCRKYCCNWAKWCFESKGEGRASEKCRCGETAGVSGQAMFARCCGKDSFPLKVAVYGRFLNVLKSWVPFLLVTICLEWSDPVLESYLNSTFFFICILWSCKWTCCVQWGVSLSINQIPSAECKSTFKMAIHLSPKGKVTYVQCLWITK